MNSDAYTIKFKAINVESENKRCVEGLISDRMIIMLDSGSIRTGDSMQREWYDYDEKYMDVNRLSSVLPNTGIWSFIHMHSSDRYYQSSLGVGMPDMFVSGAILDSYRRTLHDYVYNSIV